MLSLLGITAQWGFALLPWETLVRGKGPGQGQGGTVRICGALLASVDPAKRACMEAKVEAYLLSAFVEESKNEPLR